MIYHVVTLSAWQKALQQGFYEAASLATEGFIHASKEEQVKGVLQRYYKDQTGLLLLHIDENKLTAPFEKPHAVEVVTNESFNGGDSLITICVDELQPLLSLATIVYVPPDKPFAVGPFPPNGDH